MSDAATDGQPADHDTHADPDRGTYEVYAIRYGRSMRARADSFIGGDPAPGAADPHDQSSMPMAYYVWLIRNAARAILVDTGFDPAVAALRKREFLICPGEAITRLGVAAAEIRDVILTHLHYDHAGNHQLFAQARFHIQASEMAYVTSPWMTHPWLRGGYAADDVKVMVDRLFADRLVFHGGEGGGRGDGEVAPGVSVFAMPGHTAGLQAVRVQTAHGPLLLASDSAVFYEGLTSGRAFPPAFHVGSELAGYRRLLDEAGSIDRIIPGHDVKVMDRYPAVLDGVAWRVDGAPLGRF